MSRRRDKVTVATSKIIPPYEPGYVANKEADKRRKETKERLRQRERELPNGNSRRQSWNSMSGF